MDGAREFRGQRGVDHAMALDPALPFEGRRHNIDPEMGFAAGPMAAMAFVQMGLVDHIEALGNESLSQLLCDVIFGAQGR